MYDNGLLWTAAELPVSSLETLATAVDGLRKQPHTCIVRGKAKTLGVPQRRTKDPKPDLPIPTFDTAPHRWIMFDVDGPDIGINQAEHPTQAVEALRASLPSPWNTAACYWQASASAGIKPGVRVHLWYWLDRPISDAEAKRIAVSLKVAYNVDAQLYQAVQPHYCADPIFVGGPDPMQERAGILDGEPEAVVPANTPSVKEWQVAEKQLAQVCKFLAKVVPGERAPRVYGAAKDMGRTSCLSDATLETALTDAAISAAMPPEEARGHVKRGLAAGRAQRGEQQSQEWRQGLRTDQEGALLPTIGNLQEIVRLHPDLCGAFANQTRTGTLQVLRTLPWRQPGDLDENDALGLQVWFDKLGLKVSRQDTWALMNAAAAHASYDPFKDYLSGLTWDGTPRLSAMYRLFQVEPSGYAERTFRCWMISAVARTFVPGCQADHMLILQSPEQGLYKSASLRALLPSASLFATFGGKGRDLHDPDSLMKLHGPVFVCVDEMSAFKGRDAEAIKSFVTEVSDFYRPKYGRVAKHFPRTNVFCGTSNDDTFLTDATGARRFWPHLVTASINIASIEAVRDQLWAEARHAFEAGERHYLTPSETRSLGVEGHQEKRREVSPFEEQLSEFLASKKDFLQTRVIAEGMGVSMLELTNRGSMFGKAMRALGWEKHRPSPVKGVGQPTGWRKRGRVGE
jgi:predicted P-loop ATPase